MSLADYQGGWDDKTLEQLAFWANDAYKDTVEKGVFIENDETDTQAYLINYGDYAVLAFRGTEVASLLVFLKFILTPFGFRKLRMSEDDKKQLADIGHDLDVAKVPWKEGKVHRGFKKSFESIHTQLVEELGKLSPKARQNLFITGHSLGGALATLAASKFDGEADIRVKLLVTFGSPRVGDFKFAQQFEKKMVGRYFRVFNKTDIVARIPCRFRFSHVGTPIFIDKDDEIWIRVPIGIRIFTVLLSLVTRGKSSLAKDHGMWGNYVKVFDL